MDSQTLRTVRGKDDAPLNGRVMHSLGGLTVAALLLAACGADQAAPENMAGTMAPAATTAAIPAPTAAPTPVAGAPSQPSAMMAVAPQPSMPAAPNASVPTPTPAMSSGSVDAIPAGAGAPMDESEMGTPTLFWLDIGSDRVFRANADGTGSKMIASGSPLSAADGVAVDRIDGHVFVLNMGSITGGGNNASLVRYKLDGTSPEVIIPAGSKVGNVTFNTGKQVTMDTKNRKLYMADREGGKVWRSDMDGKNLEILVSGHGIMQVVGIGTDWIRNKFYFSDKTGHKIFRAGMDMPEGKTHADREDVEMLYVDSAARVASSLDIELDLKAQRIYWTDKDQNIVFGMNMEMPAGKDATTRTDVDKVVMGLTGVIGLGFDQQEGMLYATNGGSVTSFKTDGSGLKMIGSGGSTGITFVRLP